MFGGVGRLYGAFIGATVYMIAQDQLAKMDPEFWYFWIGLLLVLMVMFARGGILGLFDRVVRTMMPSLETVGLHKRFGALVVANDINFRLEPGARHALIGPNGAGKTTFINLITGRLSPSAGRVLLGGRDVRRCRRPSESVAASGGRFRSIRCSAACRCWRMSHWRWPNGKGAAATCSAAPARVVGCWNGRMHCCSDCGSPRMR